MLDTVSILRGIKRIQKPIKLAKKVNLHIDEDEYNNMTQKQSNELIKSIQNITGNTTIIRFIPKHHSKVEKDALANLKIKYDAITKNRK